MVSRVGVGSSYTEVLFWSWIDKLKKGPPLPMKFVFASDSFKGSLSSARICQLLEEAARRHFPRCECASLLMADGGEGTLDAIAHTREGVRLPIDAHDALMRPLRSKIFLADAEAFVEVAKTCGLAMLPAQSRNPLATSSFGVGDSIRAAFDAGAERISVGLGGSSTNDGGMGCLNALGVRFMDASGSELPPCGANLGKVESIDAHDLDPRLSTVPLSIMCDVGNPLLGPQGATQVFGPQKGADAATIAQLESGMQHFAQAVGALYPAVDFATPGFGAAGGLGMALGVFCGARMERGIDAMLRWTHFDQHAEGATLVVTGEGQMDDQTFAGKVPLGVLERARLAGVPVAAICGRIEGGRDMRQRLADAGFSAVVETSAGLSIEEAMAQAETNYARAADELFASLM